jgi:leader peptidase (prepilin peptidase)/N-methyltransferase
MIRIFGTIFAGLLGLAFGSFLNVCLSRWPEGESVVQPRSHCRSCSHTLAWWENLPLLSWMALRGRCRGCRSWIGVRYPAVEFALGALWAYSAWQLPLWGFAPDAPTADIYFGLAVALWKMIFYWILVALAVLDAENLWLPNWITLPGVFMGFIFTVAVANPGFRFQLHAGGVGFRAHIAGISLLSIAAAAGLILLIRWIYWLVRRREGIGLGDAKLMALLAAWLGLPGALLSFGLGVVLGAVVAVVLLAVSSARNSSGGWALKKLPLGSFLCMGGIVSSLWGQQIIAAYLRWVGF